MDHLLTERELMFKRQMREFATKEIEPFAAEWDRRDEFAWDGFKKIAGIGLMGLAIPEKYGGQGGSTVESLIASIELARASHSIASFFNSFSGLTLGAICRNGTEEQRQKFVVPVAKGEKICCFGLTEREAGSDMGNMSTTARKEGDWWVINGAKCFISGGNVADIVLLFATIDRALKTRGITAFLVEKGTPGFSIGSLEAKMGIRGCSHAEIMFDDCRIPASAQLGEPGRGARIALSALDYGRLDVAGEGVGLAEAALETAIAYSKHRQQFGQSISQFQGIQWMLADMATAVDASKLLCYRAARLADSGRQFSKEAAQAKLFASETAMNVTRKAIQIHGGYGYMRDLPLERFYRDAKILEIYEGTNEISRMVISRSLLA